MSVIRNLHNLLGPPIAIRVRQKFAYYYNQIDQESKDNWRIRFSILKSLIGKLLLTIQKTHILE